MLSFSSSISYDVHSYNFKFVVLHWQDLQAVTKLSKMVPELHPSQVCNRIDLKIRWPEQWYSSSVSIVVLTASVNFLADLDLD